MDLLADAIVTNESVGFGIPKPTENRMSSQWWLESLMGVEHKLCLHRPHREINNYNISNPDLFESQFSKKKKRVVFCLKETSLSQVFTKKGHQKFRITSSTNRPQKSLENLERSVSDTSLVKSQQKRLTKHHCGKKNMYITNTLPETKWN